MSIGNAPRASSNLHYSIVDEMPNDGTHNVFLAVGPKKKLYAGRNLLAQDGKLMALEKISAFPENMALGMKAHFREYTQKYNTGLAQLGAVELNVRKVGARKVAYAIEYHPKGHVRDGIEIKKNSGINAALLEAEILKHLKASGVTHMTTTDGFRRADARGLKKKKTNEKRRAQLLARGIDPAKTYPIDEWIAKLRSVPDYSKIGPKN